MRRLLEVASRSSYRELGERSGYNADKQSRELIICAKRGMEQLGQLEALEELGPPEPWPIADTPTQELGSLALALVELGDAAREATATLGRVAAARKRLVQQLEQSVRTFSELTQALDHARVSLARVVRLESDMKIRALAYDKDLGSAQAEIVNRWLKRLNSDLQRIAEHVARWGERLGRG